MENNFWTASRRFWSTIRRLRVGKRCSINTVYGEDGALLTSAQDVVSRWKEYFEDLLNPTDMPSNEEAESGDLGVDSPISGAEVVEVVKKLLGGRAPGVDEIRPEFLKALDVAGLSWLTHICSIAWTSGAVPLDWQNGVVVPIFKKGDRRVCSTCRGITLLSLPGKVYLGVLERKVCRIVEPRIQEEQCGFRPGRGTVDQLYTLGRVLEGAWEFAQPVYMCFVDLEKAFDRVPRGVLWGVLREYVVPRCLIRAVRSLYNRCQSLVRIAGSKSDSFLVRVGLRQGCPLSPILFITFMDRIYRRSQGVEGVQFGDLRIRSLIFADDVVLLASSDRDLRLSLEQFAVECEAAEMKISTSKSETMVLSRKRVACSLRVGEEVLPQMGKFKYLGVFFTSEGRMEWEIDRRIGAASAMMQALHRSVMVKKELSQKAKLSIYRSIYVSTLTYGHELWVVTERMRSRVQAAEMSFLHGWLGSPLEIG
uniref:Reverse transcriptase domain-containing protein n=1 Tax=Paramormyrops kingsleyae TaxID=1676925 RepID=A0A3B3QGI4_9TELE